MKIREIMKRTMAIGLATAMLLQSQSVVTLAETVQTDAAETVVVDVGEDAIVSDNNAESDEIVPITILVKYGQKEARDMLQLINDFRQGEDAWAWNETNTEKVYYKGLKPLTYDYKLEEIAMQRAAEIAFDFAHNRPDGSEVKSLFSGYRSYGENIAAGYTTYEDMFVGWREDEGDYIHQCHRINMLRANASCVGIGHVIYNGYNFWVMELGKPNSMLDSAEVTDQEVPVQFSILKSKITDIRIEAPEDLVLNSENGIEIPNIKVWVKSSSAAMKNREMPVVTKPIWQIEDASVAKIENNKIYGQAIGNTNIISNIGEKEVKIPLKVLESGIYIDEDAIREDTGVSKVKYVYGSVNKDVLTSVHRIENTHAAFRLEVVGKNPENITKYQILSDKKIIAESADGIFKDLDPSKFSSDKPIYIVTTGKTRCVKTKLLLEIKEPKGIEKLKKSTLKLGGSAIEFKLPENVPIYGGSEMKLNLPELPVSAIIEDGKLKVGINIKEKELYSRNSYEGVTTTTKKGDLGKRVKSWEKDMMKSQFIKKDMSGYLQQANLKADVPLFQNKVSYKVIGYFEGAWSDSIEKVSGQLVIELSGDSTFQGQYVLMSIPITLNVKNAGKATATIEGAYDFIDSHFLADLGLKFEVSVEPYGGVGAGTWCSLGVYGKAQGNLDIVLATPDANTPKGINEVSVEGNAGIKAYFAKKEIGKLELISTQLLNKTKLKPYMDEKKLLIYSKTKNSVLRSNDGKEDIGASLKDYSFNTKQLDASAELLAETSSSFDNKVLKENIIVDRVYEAASPIITNIDGQKLLIYTDIDNSRNTYNQTAIYYSLYDESTGRFEEPQVLDNDDTADYRPQVYEDGENLFVYFSDSNTVYEEDAAPSLSEYAKTFGISIYKFNSEKKEFEEIVVINENQYCYHPTIYKDGEKILLGWAENSEGNVFGADGVNTIKAATITNDGTYNIEVIADDVRAITGLAIGNMDNEARIVYTEAQENNLYGEQICKLVISDLSGNVQAEKVTELAGIKFEDLYQNGNNVLMAEQQGEIVTIDNTLNIQDIIPIETGGAISEFVVDNGKIYCINTDSQGARNISILQNIEGIWCSTKITEETDYVDAVSVSDGMLVYLLTQVDMTSYEDENTEAVIDSESCIKLLKSDMKQDITLEYVDFDEYEVEAGKEIPVQCIVTNKGTEVLENLNVTLSADDEIISEGSVCIDILPGQSKESSVMLHMPQEISDREYVIRVSDSNNEENRSEKKVKFFKSDIDVSGEYIVTEEGRYLKAYVANIGVLGNKVTTSIVNRKGETVFSDTQIVKENDSVTYTYELTEDDLPKAGEECFITIQAETESEDIYMINNTYQQLLSGIDIEKPKVVEASVIAEEDKEETNPTPSPAPTQMPVPTESPVPTQTPVPTESPMPTQIPNPTPTTPASTSIYTYEVLSDGTIRITSCQTSDVNLVIPDTIDGYTVTEIGTSAFANQTSIQTVKFPANLKQIGVKAFANCTGLLEVTLPDTIQGAGQLCFSGCTALKKAVLNKGRINIVYGMFENCTSLTEVVIPDTVENIAMYAFLNCRSLTHLNLPASMKSISVHAFEGAGVTTITYAGTKAQWQKVKKNLTGNGSFVTATVTDSTGVSFAVSGSNNGNQNPQQTVKKPGKVKITKAKNVKTKKLTVKWKKTSKAKGYQIQIASNKKFTKGKKTKTLSKTIYSFKKLKKNKYYYVRVRAYVYDSNHKKVYGSWSMIKKVKIKK